MIELTKSFKTSDGRVWTTIEQAQQNELTLLYDAFVEKGNPEMTDADVTTVKFILANKAKILDILSTKTNSRPRARKINGGTKSRVAPTAPAPAVSAAGPLYYNHD